LKRTVSPDTVLYSLFLDSVFFPPFSEVLRLLIKDEDPFFLPEFPVGFFSCGKPGQRSCDEVDGEREE
jgi:hypothetical protein